MFKPTSTTTNLLSNSAHQVHSIYCRHLMRLSLSASQHDQCNLNSKQDKVEKNFYGNKKLLFDYKIGTTETRSTFELTIVENIENINLVKWIEDFNDAVERAKWDEETKLEVLIALFPQHIRGRLGEYKSLSDFIGELRKLKCPKSKALLLQKKLATIRQTEYPLIEKYIADIKNIISNISWSLNLSKAQITALTEQSFFMGLHQTTIIKASELNLNTMQNIVDHVKTVENTLMEFIPENRKNDNKSNNSNDNTVWCSYHKTSLHSNSECSAQKKRKEKRKQLKKEMKEAYTKLKAIDESKNESNYFVLDANI